MRIDALDATMEGALPVGLSMLLENFPHELMVMGATGRTWEVDPATANQMARPAGPMRGRGRGLLDLHDVTRMLHIGRNKLRILRLLRRPDWISILHLLPKEMLVNALRLFNKTKLLRLIMMMPKRMLLKVLLQLFKIEDLVQKMPTSELMRILRSRKLNNRELLKGIQKMQPKFQLLLLQRVYGDYDFSTLKPYDFARIIMHTSKERLMEGFKTLPFAALVPMVTEFVKKDPDLLLLLSDAFIFKLFDKMTKPTLLQGCMALPNDLIIKMLTQLPDPMLMLAAAQIDDKTLEQYLIAQHGNLLRTLAGVA